ncbi:MAG TPA: nuclease-related domain-containing protein [Pontiellaceae bacterium]|nr:nuclease-related domain-containing protein [Pontiellaceae bacterium]HPR83293.1 nuclease-related domain-containing protein [Pontiellaceae bacterium]
MNSEKTTDRFAKVYGSPGQGPRTLGPLRVFWPLIPICLAAGWLLRAAAPVPEISTSQAGALFVLLAVTLVVFIGWSAKRLRSFLKGAEGEETVARILSFLPANHTVFNDLQLDPGGPAFDHIVVAPAGIFVIETKTWSGEITFQNGQVLCNGHLPSRPPLKQVREEAAALVDHLAAAGCPAAPVYPVVCFVGNRPQDGHANIGGVRICTETDLRTLFENTLETPIPAGTLGMITSELARCAEDK